MQKEMKKNNESQTIVARFGIDTKDMKPKDVEELSEELQEFETFVLARAKKLSERRASQTKDINSLRRKYNGTTTPDYSHIKN